MTNNSTHQQTLCIGAGPAGLTAAYLLSQENHQCLVLEKDSNYVGGISRTVKHQGFRFDIGGHRFFSKSAEVNDLWNEILPDDLIDRPRKSRIYYNKKFFSYPIKPVEALLKLNIWNSSLALLSYLKSRLLPIKPALSFQDWVSNQFGAHLFSIFFKTYTEKVWGMPCSEISADWAAQRIKGLSLFSAVKNALLPSRMNKVKSLITTFRYPRLGPGMMWEAAAQKIQQQTSEIKLGATVTGLTLKGETWEINYQQNESEYKTTASEVISSMPLRELVNCLTPAVPNEIIKAANALRYRDFLVVALMTNCEGDFDDNWIYIHDPEVKVGRVQNFRSWSPDLIPEAGKNCYGLEYFCFEGDGLWDSSDEQLIELAIKEITQIGLAKREAITDGYVVRQAKAYPVYDADYQKNVKIIADYLEANYPTLHLVGRNGMHKYNNQDHAMMTAMLTAKNILSQSKQYDVWQVNQDAEYHESERLVPQKIQIAKQPSPAEQ